MKHFLKILFFFILLSNSISCKKEEKFSIAFGSCDNQGIENKMWEPILKHKPDLFIWGGDVIYSDTDDMKRMKKNYAFQKNDPVYLAFTKKTEILGTWDDHDYGVNDGGAEYPKKDSVQQLFLDFLDTPENDVRRKQKGVYYAKDYQTDGHLIRIIILDTRYYRTPLTKDTTGVKRYVPNPYGQGTMLGDTQWKWLENELQTSKADFNIIVSSIQFLSWEHGFETWGNMPHEVDKLERLIRKSGAKGVIILSGDRHIAEISAKNIDGVPYPLIDFTSSGMTHSYKAYKGEPNRYRKTKVVSDKNFGLLTFDLKHKTVQMEIRGEYDILYETFSLTYQY